MFSAPEHCLLTTAPSIVSTYGGIVLLGHSPSQGGLSGGGGAHHAHLAGDAGLGGQQVGPGVPGELHQGLC